MSKMHRLSTVLTSESLTCLRRRLIFTGSLPKYSRSVAAWPCLTTKASPSGWQHDNPHRRRYLSSGSGAGDEASNGSDPHKLFKAQLEELDAERRLLFGDNHDDADADLQHQEPDDLLSQANHHSKLAQEQLLMKSSAKRENNDVSSSSPQPEGQLTPEEIEDREALFQFSEEDKQAWGASNAGQHVLSKDLMEEIERARQQQELRGQDSDQQFLSTPSSPPPNNQTNDDHHESFSHVTQDGVSVHMVDVGHKQVTTRTAKAQTKVILPDDVLQAFASSKEELVGPKGPIFATAKLAGIMAAKKTSDLIPLCHPLPLDQVKIDVRLHGNEVIIDCTCRVTHKTGVEMEALTGSSVAALTVYDMVKAVSHQVEITNTRLISKTGGKRTVSNEP